MTPEQIEARRKEISERRDAITTELETLASKDDFDDEKDGARFDELDTEFKSFESELTRMARLEEIRKAATDPTKVEDGSDKRDVNVNVRDADDPYNAEFRTSLFDGPDKMNQELRARATKAVEIDEEMADPLKEAALRTLRRADDPTGEVARRFLFTGHPDYRSAWIKKMAGRDDALTNDERKALSRAMSLTDANGGFAVPFTLDPTVIYTGDGSVNPLRAISRVVQITTDSWNGVSSAGSSAAYGAEGAEVADGSFTLGDEPIPVHKAHWFLPYSIEIGQDWAGLAETAREFLMEARDDLEASKFTVGTGTNQPTGIIKALDGSASEVAPTTAETFAVADIYKVIEALPPRYRARARWMANKAIFHDVRQFDNNGGADLWVTLAGADPDQLVGYAAHEASAMDSGFDAAATADNFILLLGDFRNFVIVDRVGMATEYIPHLFHVDNNRPSGQRGLYAHWRNGSNCVNVNGFRLLNVATAA